MTPGSILTEIFGTDIQQISPNAIMIAMEGRSAVNEHATMYLKYRQTPDNPFQHKDYQAAELTVKCVLTDGTLSQIFEGMIERCRVHYEPSGSFLLELWASDDTKQLEYRRQFFTYPDLSAQAKLDQMVNLTGVPGFKATLSATGDVQFQRSYQTGETMWDHLLGECADLGLMVVPSFSGLSVSDDFTDSGVQLPFSQEDGLLSFEVQTDWRLGRRFGVNYDREASKSRIFQDVTGDKPTRFGPMTSLLDVIEAEATSPLAAGRRPFVTIDAEALADSELKTDSKQQVSKAIRGRGECRDPRFGPGDSLTITGNGIFQGQWGVIAMNHHFRPSGYFNDFECTPYNSAIAPEAGVIPPLPFPVRARVTSVPTETTDRIQVQMPWEADNSNSLFWPWLSPYTGAGRGISFPPEIGDEVLVQLVNGEGKSAYIMCGAWNGVDKVPLDPLHGGERENNDIKRIVTKSGNRLVMDDKDGKETIVMATPNHVRVSLFDGGKTLVLHSDGDIKIHAGGTVHMRCAQFLREIGS